MKNVLIIIPTYNESENISVLVPKIFSINPAWHILIIDDNSPDGTSDKAKDLKSSFPNLHLINRTKKLGLGSAYIDGFKYALSHNFDLILQMDADLSHSPEDIDKMIELSADFDLIIGSRYVKNGKTPGLSFIRKILSKSANIYSSFLLRIPVKDSTSGFKCIKSQLLKKIEFETISSKGYAFQIEIVFRSFLKNARIKEYPIIFYSRINDKSKMSLMIIIEAFSKVFYMAFNKKSYLDDNSFID